jgi:guanylate kinase
MPESHSGRVVILTGPSCVGKSPLARALARFHPDLLGRLQQLVLYNSRAPRPGEVNGVDYHFRTSAQIEMLRSREEFAVLDVRGDLQALDLPNLSTLLQHGDVFFEGNPFVGRLLQSHPALAHVSRLGIFMSPLSREEILALKDPRRNVVLPDLLTDLMRRKLLRRTQRQKGILSHQDLANIERRAASAYAELREAWRFDHVIPNHDGEDSDNWEAFYYPLGEARQALLAFVDLLEGRTPTRAERWEEDLLPDPRECP